MERITSPANPRMKTIRKLRERKERQVSGLFYVEGLRIVVEAFQQKADVVSLIVAPELLSSKVGQDLVADQIVSGVPILEVSTQVFETISLKEGPVGLAAIVRQNWHGLEAVELDEGDTWVALDSIADPGNLGTIMRVNDAVGGRGIILLDNSTDPYDPTCIRASMGAIFSQKLVRASFSEFASWKKAHSAPVVGTSDKAKMDYQAYRYPKDIVVLMGSERQGLPEQQLKLCDEVVSIPMVGRSDSLNLAVATGIVLYEIFNQRRRNNSAGRDRMIASVRGEVIGVTDDSLVIEVGGVGLFVHVPAPLLAEARIGERIFLQTFLVVRQDAMVLYGFERDEDRAFFNLLLGADGVGPRTALSSLSTLTVDAIRRAVLSEQADIFGRVPGVGKRTAQKILVHLQGRVGSEVTGFPPAAGMPDVDTEVMDA